MSPRPWHCASKRLMIRVGCIMSHHIITSLAVLAARGGAQNGIELSFIDVHYMLLSTLSVWSEKQVK